MSKLKDALANPTPRLSTPQDTEAVVIARNKYIAIRDEMQHHEEEVERLREEYDKALKHLVDLRYMETVAKQRVFDEDEEYQNHVDNEMAHADTQS